MLMQKTVRISAYSMIVAVAATLLGGTPASAQLACEGLAARAFGDTLVVQAQSFAGGSFTAPDGIAYENVPSFCKVSAVANPTQDSVINIEVWMPTQGWNGRMVGQGNGGYAGTIALGVPAMVAAIQAGAASANTDMGTAPSSNNDGDALIGHPQKWADFGWRATHEMTVAAKAIIAAFYGKGPQYAYFNGCSTGGQQALMEAERFPGDYNGILGGDPANNRTHVHTNVLWIYRLTHLPADALFTSGQTQAITAAVVAACAVKSGGLATDPFLTDPRACDWDPGTLACTTANEPNCLNPDQVAAARLIYDGPRNPATGQLIFPGSVKGSESDGQFGWVGLESQPDVPFGSLFKWVFGPTFLWPAFDFSQDMTSVDQLLAPVLNANNADLSAFQRLGGKLIMYQGWADPLVSPQDLIDYYLRAVAKSGSGQGALKATQRFFRLFMVPGMYHCAFGPGPNAFGNQFSGQVYAAPPPSSDPEHDILAALQQWVEKGVAPDRVVATKYNGDVANLGIVMQRPICPFPLVPRYSGSGDPNSADSFACVVDNNTNNPTAAPIYLQ
jgi:feruloyl esterase